MTARLGAVGTLGALLASLLAMVTSTAAAPATRLSRCTAVRDTRDAVQWQPVYGGVYFSVRWNPRFQAHELLWANRTRRDVRVEYLVLPRGVAQAPDARWLPAGTEETLPGQSVRPSASGRVCLELLRAPS
ncbi:hypothetical protein [Gemmatimonas sp.]|uniref:hypothetical protein n=1 Tax=Gemmatimonas sp. TaxID=1962908 RepID=UPI0033415F29